MRILLISSLFLAPNMAWSLCVSAPQANLRSKPSTKSQVLWTVGRYMPLLEVDSKGSWYLVKDLEGKKMWISASLVSDDFDCAVIRVDKTSLYKDPERSAPKTPLAFAFKYMPFKKLQREEDWLYLQDAYGGKHWIADRYLWEPLEYTRVNY